MGQIPHFVRQHSMLRPSKCKQSTSLQAHYDDNQELL